MKSIKNAIKNPCPKDSLSSLSDHVVASSSKRPTSSFSRRPRKETRAEISDFESYLTSLVTKELLNPRDILFLRAKEQIWSDLRMIFETTWRLKEWTVDRAQPGEKREYTDPPMEALKCAFEPLTSTPNLRAFTKANIENWLIAHIITAPLQERAVRIIANMRSSGKVVCRHDRIGFVTFVQPMMDMI